jgi:hypothetical protein
MRLTVLADVQGPEVRDVYGRRIVRIGPGRVKTNGA